MLLTRRLLLPFLAAGAAACEGVPGSIEPRADDAGLLPPQSGEDGAPATLVVVFQRFAADWINMLVPAGDPAYGPLRPQLAVADPLPLDGYFGLHPSLQGLLPLYESGELGFIAATGWIPLDSRDRSHFFAQTIAESGARAGVSDGWLGRVMQRDARNDGLWAALAAEGSVPVSLQGFANAIALRDFADYNHGSIMAGEATALLETLAQSAGEPGAVVHRLATSMRAVEQSPPPVSSVVYPATNLGQGLKVAAQAIRGNLAPRVITVTSDDDWDTHVTQASRHAASLPNFAGALVAFREDLGERFSEVTLVTMTEFGRKARENFGGTDHGTGSSMLVMGGGVAGKRVYGAWPGLHDSALFQGEDLEPTTDFRSVLGELLGRHLGAADSTLDEIFPGGYARRDRWRGFLR